jgi:pullulanase
VVEEGLVSYQLKNNTNNDSWKNILVIYNAKRKPVNYKLDKTWNVTVINDTFDFKGKETVSKNIEVPAVSIVVLFQNQLN